MLKQLDAHSRNTEREEETAPAGSVRTRSSRDPLGLYESARPAPRACPSPPAFNSSSRGPKTGLELAPTSGATQPRAQAQAPASRDRDRNTSSVLSVTSTCAEPEDSDEHLFQKPFAVAPALALLPAHYNALEIHPVSLARYVTPAYSFSPAPSPAPPFPIAHDDELHALTSQHASPPQSPNAHERRSISEEAVALNALPDVAAATIPKHTARAAYVDSESENANCRALKGTKRVRRVRSSPKSRGKIAAPKKIQNKLSSLDAPEFNEPEVLPPPEAKPEKRRKKTKKDEHLNEVPESVSKPLAKTAIPEIHVSDPGTKPVKRKASPTKSKSKMLDSEPAEEKQQPPIEPQFPEAELSNAPPKRRRKRRQLTEQLSDFLLNESDTANQIVLQTPASPPPQTRFPVSFKLSLLRNLSSVISQLASGPGPSHPDHSSASISDSASHSRPCVVEETAEERTETPDMPDVHAKKKRRRRRRREERAAEAAEAEAAEAAASPPDDEQDLYSGTFEAEEPPLEAPPPRDTRDRDPPPLSLLSPPSPVKAAKREPPPAEASRYAAGPMSSPVSAFSPSAGAGRQCACECSAAGFTSPSQGASSPRAITSSSDAQSEAQAFRLHAKALKHQADTMVRTHSYAFITCREHTRTCICCRDKGGYLNRLCIYTVNVN